MASEFEYGVVDDTQPIMVSGVYRSGTTFLSAMLGAHSKLKASSSTIKFLRFCLGRYGDVCKEDNYRRLIAETHKRIQVRWGLSLDEEKILRQLSTYEEVSYALLYDLMMRSMLLEGQNTASRWVEKLAVQWEDIPLFLNMFPNGRVIHIYRDPRDVAASYKSMTFEPGNTFLDAAFNFRGAMETMAVLEKQYGQRLLVVKAEKIAQTPEVSVKQICVFLGLEFETSMVDASQLHTEGEDWASNTSFSERHEKLPDGKSRWPQFLTRAEVIFIEMIAQPYFTKFGYDSAGYTPDPKDWEAIYEYIHEPFLDERFRKWLGQGKGAQGYRTDPYMHEMKIVFPERYDNVQN
jgi:sulfotransferase family protein